MAALDDTAATPAIEIPYPLPQSEDGSLRARLAARRAALQQRESVVLDVPGYDGIIAARYRALDWSEMRKIAARHERERDVAVQELYIAADTLVMACEELCEVTPDGPRGLGVRWTPRAADELFGAPGADTSRRALLAAIPRDLFVVQHFGAFAEWNSGVNDDAQHEVGVELGKTPPAAAGS